MLKDMSKFQLFLYAGLILFAVVGLLGFSMFSNENTTTSVIVEAWGTVDERIMEAYFQKVALGKEPNITIHYKHFSLENFDKELLEALASNRGPDMIVTSQETILKQVNKILPISYKTFPQVEYKSAFVQEAELFLAQNGILAFPFAVDPMVMYWNRDIFSNAQIPLPPKYWDEFLTLAPKLTKKDGANNITQSAVALGEYRNVQHAKDIVSLITLQAGSPITVLTSNGYQSVLANSFNYTIAPAHSALSFYTQFADPLKTTYSWNRAMDNSQQYFIENKLGVYFGYASEYSQLKQKNPNLNFDVALVPQLRRENDSTYVQSTYGNMYGFAILKASSKTQYAFNAIYAMSAKENVTLWAQQTGLPSVRRDTIIQDPSKAASSIFATSAIWARGWLDPDYQASEAIFKEMIESVTSGRKLYSDAIISASQEQQNLLNKVNENLNPTE
jgi:multiple sugar transport system substrate-binding protein